MTEGLQAGQSHFGEGQAAGRVLGAGRRLRPCRVWLGRDTRGAVWSVGTRRMARRIVGCPLFIYSLKSPLVTHGRVCRAGEGAEHPVLQTGPSPCLWEAGQRCGLGRRPAPFVSQMPLSRCIFVERMGS